MSSKEIDRPASTEDLLSLFKTISALSDDKFEKFQHSPAGRPVTRYEMFVFGNAVAKVLHGLLLAQIAQSGDEDVLKPMNDTLDALEKLKEALEALSDRIFERSLGEFSDD